MQLNHEQPMNSPKSVQSITPIIAPQALDENTSLFNAANNEINKSVKALFDSTTKYNTQDAISSSLASVIPANKASQLVLKTPELSPVIECYANSIAGDGWRFEYIGLEGKQGSTPALTELDNAKYAIESLHPIESLTTILKKFIRDRETLGYAFLEVTRDMDGNVATLEHVPANEVLLFQDEIYPQTYTQGDYAGKTFRPKQYSKFFKRFIRFPMLNSGKVQNPIHYKEVGSNTVLSRTGGVFASVEALEAAGHVLADELIFLPIYTTGVGVGVPRWYSIYESLRCVELADKININNLEGGGIPAMVIMVSGGNLSEEAMDSLRKAFNSGSYKTMTKALVIEALGDNFASSESGSIPPPKIQLEPLHDKRQTDAMYQDLIEKVSERIMATYRINPMMLGKIQNVNYSTAEQAILLVEQQVFIPERRLIEDIISNYILRQGDQNKPLRFWKFKLNPNTFMTPDSIVRLLKAADNAGSLTPNVGIGVLNKFTDMSIEQVNEAWGDYPKEFTSIAISQGRETELKEIMNPMTQEAGTKIDNKATGVLISDTGVASGNADSSKNGVREILNDIKTTGKINTNNLGKKN